MLNEKLKETFSNGEIIASTMLHGGHYYELELNGMKVNLINHSFRFGGDINLWDIGNQVTKEVFIELSEDEVIDKLLEIKNREVNV